MEGGENGASLEKGLHVLLLVVSGVVLPTGKENANPLEGQGPNDGVIFFAFGGVVIDIIAGPLTLGHGEAGKFVKGLAIKFRAGLAHKDELALAAAFGHRGDTGEALNVQGLLVTRAVGAKEGTQPWGQ